MKDVILAAKVRQEKGTHLARRMRNSGVIPAVLYGSNEGAVSLAIGERDFQKVIHGATGENVILNLKIDDEQKGDKTAIVKEIQRDPVNQRIVHVDFKAISLKEKIKVNVPIQTIGEAPGIKEGGVLEYFLRELEIECLPTNIPEHITVDVSTLGINASVHVRDLVLPDKDVRIVTPGDRMLVSIVPPTVLEEKAPAADAVVAEVAPVEPEVIKKGKKEGEGEAGETKEEKEKK